jgi:FkbM family methyltransferase
MRAVQRDSNSFIVEDPPSYPEFWDHFADGRWEPETFDIFRKHIKAEDTFVDVGAWIGPTALYASTLCKKVVAVEPDPVAFRQLDRHVEINDRRRCIELRQLAITDFNGDIQLGSDILGNSETRSGNSRNRFGVQCCTLRKLLDCIPGSLFIKMDIEGGEETVLRSSLEVIEERKPVLYVSLHPWLYVDTLVMEHHLKRLISLYSKTEWHKNAVVLS